MRTTAIALGALLCLVLSPSVNAGDGHGQGKGKGHNHGSGGGGGGGGGPKTRIEGAGQRLHFSFGGELRFKQGKVTGHFAIISHPLAPDSERLVVACKYHDFKNASLAGTRLEFDGHGVCKVLEIDGDTDSIQVKNRFVIVDNPSGSDQIDVEFIGSTGIMIPGGELAFGNFTFTTS